MTELFYWTCKLPEKKCHDLNLKVSKYLHEQYISRLAHLAAAELPSNKPYAIAIVLNLLDLLDFTYPVCSSH